MSNDQKPPELKTRTGNRPPMHMGPSSERDPQHEPVHDAPRKRMRRNKSNVHQDPYSIPLDQVPDGASYEWKRWSVNGQVDPYYIAQMREQGWEPVDPKRHPDWVPPGYSDPYLIKSGLILMERPIELTREARDESRGMAREQIRVAEARLGMTPKDTLTRDHEAVRPRVTKEMVRPIAIEE